MLDLKGRTVFIIEDDLGNRAIMQTLLEQAGAKVFFERWGTESVEKLKEVAAVDIILLDLMFPRGVTGYDVFDAIRKELQFQEVPIVAVSASEPTISIPKTQEKGFSGFISKPVDFDNFSKQVGTILDKGSVWDVG